MIERYINKFNKPCFRGVTFETKLADLEFHEVQGSIDTDMQWALHTDIGSLTVVDRLTGFHTDCGDGVRDTETGFRDMNGNFWLATGMFDIREKSAETMQDAISMVKKNDTLSWRHCND